MKHGSLTPNTHNPTPPHRRTDFQVGSGGADYDANWHYDSNTGRLARVEAPGLPAYGVEFGYVSNSHWLDKLEFKSGSSTVDFEHNYTWAANSNQLAAMNHTWDPRAPTPDPSIPQSHGPFFPLIPRSLNPSLPSSPPRRAFPPPKKIPANS